MYIQTSSFKIAKVGDPILFAVNRRSSFQEQMTRFDNFCAQYINTRRDDFFPGKGFSEEKVPNSWVPSVRKNIFGASIDRTALIRNQYDQPVKIADLSTELDAVAVLYVSNIVFDAGEIYIQYAVHQMKVFLSPELKNWLLNMDSDSEDDLHTLRDACFLPITDDPKKEEIEPTQTAAPIVEATPTPAPTPKPPTPPPNPAEQTSPLPQLPQSEESVDVQETKETEAEVEVQQAERETEPAANGDENSDDIRVVKFDT